MRARLILIGLVFAATALLPGCGSGPGWYYVDVWSADNGNGQLVSGTHDCGWRVNYSNSRVASVRAYDSLASCDVGPSPYGVDAVTCQYHGQVGADKVFKFNGSASCPATYQPLNAVYVRMVRAHVYRK
jgi:hypothetical protein